MTRDEHNGIVKNEKAQTGPAASRTAERGTGQLLGSCQADPMFTAKEVAGLLNVAARTVRLWAECDVLPAIRVGALWRFRRSELARWVAARQNRESSAAGLGLSTFPKQRGQTRRTHAGGSP